MSINSKNELNFHNKKEYPPIHTAEHILNQTMVRMFGCSRSCNTHIERKKSKCDYILSKAPSEQDVKAIETKVNEVISENLFVSEEFLPQNEAKSLVDLSKLPDDASELIRIVRIGDYDACACIGDDVHNTSEIGRFEITSHDFTDGRWRVRFKLRDTTYNNECSN